MQTDPFPLPLGAFAGLFQGSNKRGPILVAAHGWFAAIATIKHMIHRSGELNPTLASHSPKLLRQLDRRRLKKSENHRLTPSALPILFARAVP
jgi:hypothetical protein